MTTLEYDRAYIWHPYASLNNPPPVREVASASGVNLTLANGKTLIDAVSSWWCVAHGHNHPAIVEAIRSQSDRLCHVMFGGFTHDPAVQLAERLASVAPAGLNRVFFADSGSISVEVAAKMAIQYQQAPGPPDRSRPPAPPRPARGATSPPAGPNATASSPLRARTTATPRSAWRSRIRTACTRSSGAS